MPGTDPCPLWKHWRFECISFFMGTMFNISETIETKSADWCWFYHCDVHIYGDIKLFLKKRLSPYSPWSDGFCCNGALSLWCRSLFSCRDAWERVFLAVMQHFWLFSFMKAFYWGINRVLAFFCLCQIRLGCKLQSSRSAAQRSKDECIRNAAGMQK